MLCQDVIFQHAQEHSSAFARVHYARASGVRDRDPQSSSFALKSYAVVSLAAAKPNSSLLPELKPFLTPMDMMTQRRPLPFPTTLRLFLCGVLIASTAGFARGDIAPDLKTFDQEIKPLLRKFCTRCHGPDKSEGKIRFDNIDANIVSGEHFDQWEDIREAFKLGRNAAGRSAANPRLRSVN